ncbi:hypothetical protein SHANETTE_20 [Bacillus phage Shanette]|uniref:Uncharacterized protein n=1 Tax=Bacillus phage Shanette TaxID=1296656 RepID=S5MN22_9CAUD|nr:hypothetical protein AVV46_gp020 [Bacillus phage Shanette]AGR47145.1 hypothetical protein SHANETTE_20 [Bacillus phage Shanette]
MTLHMMLLWTSVTSVTEVSVLKTARTIKRVLVVTGACTLLYLACNLVYTAMTWTHPSVDKQLEAYIDTYSE